MQTNVQQHSYKQDMEAKLKRDEQAQDRQENEWATQIRAQYTTQSDLNKYYLP